MKTKFYTLGKLVLLSIAFLTFSFAVQAQTFQRDYQDGRLYFKFKDNVELNFTVQRDNSVALDAIPFIQELGEQFRLKSLVRPFDLNNDEKLMRTFMLEIEDFRQIHQVLQKLGMEQQLEYVEQVPMDYIDYVPNDTLYNMYNGPKNWKWHLDRIMAAEAWDINKGSADIKVAIVDNAVWVDHPDLADKIVLQRDTYYNTNNANPPSTGDPYDWSHGTHCAGLSGGASDNGIGTASVGFNVSLIAVKAARNDSPNGVYGYPGIQWAAQNGANVINMSWGGPGYSATNQNLINSISNMGVVLVAAAGNENTSAPHYPSAYNNVISVASIDSDDKKTDFSNFSSSVDVAAPGGYNTTGPDGLLSTTFNQATYGYYDVMAGTSMASPVAAGLAGLILSVNPALTPAQVEEVMKSTADNIDEMNPNYIGMLGAGRINAYQAVLNTPFEPTADFTTPVTLIMPGTTIDFFDLSTGAPSTWQWSFPGGTPATSNEKNPSVRYATVGTYDVSLTVTNAFGTSLLEINDYIRVTAIPEPVIFISASDNNPCIGSHVVLNDSTLYNPTTWEWTILPNTFDYVDGTSAASQNPVVSFNNTGLYNVTLTATNNNGTTSETFEDFIAVQGATPTYTVDMEDGTSGYFVIWDTIKSQSKIDAYAARESEYGIHFHGDPLPVGWKGSPSSGTPAQAWESNRSFHGEVQLCGADARSMDNVALTLDLRQTYSLGPRTSWFRVLVNGEQVADVNGTMDFNPVTPADDEWQHLTFDLSAYAGTVFELTLQTATRFSHKSQGVGDNVYIDNIAITNTTATKPLLSKNVTLKVYPNPSTGQFTVSSSVLSADVTVKVVSLLGNTVYTKSFGSGSSSFEEVINLSHLPAGIYLLSANDGKQQFNERIIIQ
ncbi:hypothetical protein MASR1M74_09700 [Lentimicrobium sp.]